MAERTVMAAFVRALKRDLPLAWFRKIHGSAFMAGLPDYVVSWNERTCWVETKDDGKKLTPTQRAEFTRMVEAGCVVFVGDDGAALAREVVVYLCIDGLGGYVGSEPLCWPTHEVRKKSPAARGVAAGRKG